MITRGSIIEALRPGVHGWWGMEYKRHPEQFREMFDVLSSSMAYERDVNLFGFGSGVVKPEGTAVTYDTMGEGFAYNYQHIAYALAWAMTHEAQQDNQYMRTAELATKDMTGSMVDAKETVGANLWNLAFSNSVTYADGLELCSTSNVLAGGGTFSNKMAVDADFSELSLEQIIIGIQGFTDHRSKKAQINPVKLFGPKELRFEFDRVLKTDLRVGTADNDINAIKSGRYLPGGSTINNWFTDTDAYFVKTDCAQGLQHFVREGLRISVDEEFNTDNILCKFYERYSFGCTDKMALFGSQGG